MYICNMIEKELGLQTEVKKTYKIGEKKLIIEKYNWKDKMKVLKKKSKLKGTPTGQKIYIDSDPTLREREVQKQIREIARKQKENAALVKIKYQKLETNEKLWA